MGRMHLHHVKSRLLAQLRRLSIGLDDLIDQLPGHLLYLSHGRHFMAGAVGCLTGCHIPAHADQSAVFSAVGQLDIGIGACVVDGPRRLRHALAHAERIQLKLFVVGLSGGRMDDRLPISHNRRSPFGLFLQISDHLRCKMSV